MHSNLWSAIAPFDIGYRMIYAEHRSPWQVQVEFFLEKAVSVVFFYSHFVIVFSIKFKFFWNYLRVKKILHIGLCLPISCSNEEIANLTQDLFNATILDAQIMHDLQPNVLKVKDLNPKTNLMEQKTFQFIG